MATLQITTEQFLEELLGSTDSYIYFNTDGKTWKNRPQTYSEAQQKLERLNNQNHDIYYIPNSGGSRDCQITQINSLFIDWDAGRDSTGLYYPIEIVQQKKQGFLLLLTQFPYKPTYVIETRNGYHVYWFLSSGATSEQFKLIQKALINYFSSDSKICNPARVMRLPGYYAHKAGQYDPFYVQIIEHNEVRYTVDIFLTYFEIEVLSSQNDSSKPNDLVISAQNNTRISSNKDNTSSTILGSFPPTINKEPLIFDTMTELTRYLSKLNIAEYLYENNGDNTIPEGGLTIKCPFHEDSTPSASIYYHTDGYCYLKCHSSQCSFESGTLIRVVQKKDGLTEGEAVIKLMKHYNLQLDDRWKEQERDKINHNIELLKQYKEWKTYYPSLYKWTHRIIRDLESKLTYAAEHITYRTSEGKGIFYCSLSEFERFYDPGNISGFHNRQNERVDRYCLLGLMEKVDESKIPYGLFRKMQEVKKTRRLKYRIQCYHIPKYTHELVQLADEIARIGSKKGIKMNSITKNSIRDIYGEKVAQRIYPQVEDVTLSESSKNLLNSIEQVVKEEIQEKGYTKSAEVIDRLSGIETWKSVHDRRVKSLLPGLMDKLSLVEVTANKESKKQFGIISEGYPKIIIPKPVESNSVESHQEPPDDTRFNDMNVV